MRKKEEAPGAALSESGTGTAPRSFSARRPDIVTARWELLRLRVQGLQADIAEALLYTERGGGRIALCRLANELMGFIVAMEAEP
jgi:hypothetical protein